MPPLSASDLVENLVLLGHQSRDRERMGSIRSVMLPSSVNATFHRGLRQITVPLALLAEPFFTGRVDATSLGSLGALIGHEARI